MSAPAVDPRLTAVDPQPAPPATPPAWFTPCAVSGGHAYVSGQVAFGPDGALIASGRLGEDLDVAAGAAAARQCAVNALAVLGAAAGGLDAVAALVKVTVFVASAPTFTDQPLVANGASEVLFEVLGEAGRHARAAVGVASLPLGTPVEVELVARLRT